MNFFPGNRFETGTRRCVSAQSFDLGFENPKQIKIIMDELWAKSTTQNHNISMYCNLCVLLNKHLNEFSFHRMLVRQCQGSFYEGMKPVETLAASVRYC